LEGVRLPKNLGGPWRGKTRVSDVIDVTRVGRINENGNKPRGISGFEPRGPIRKDLVLERQLGKETH